MFESIPQWEQSLRCILPVMAVLALSVCWGWLFAIVFEFTNRPTKRK